LAAFFVRRSAHLGGSEGAVVSTAGRRSNWRRIGRLHAAASTGSSRRCCPQRARGSPRAYLWGSVGAVVSTCMLALERARGSPRGLTQRHRRAPFVLVVLFDEARLVLDLLVAGRQERQQRLDECERVRAEREQHQHRRAREALVLRRRMQLLVTKQHLARHHQMLRRMQCKYLPARSAIRDGQSRCNQDAIKMQSYAIRSAIRDGQSRCNQMQSDAIRSAIRDGQSRCNQMQSDAIRSAIREVLRGTQWYSEVLRGTQRYSEVLRGPCTQCEYGAVGGEKEKGG
jgi:hypothetical protein